MKRVVVVGGGVIGVTTAVALVERGLSVALVEQADSLCEGASSLNGGQLSYSFAEPLATPTLARDILRLLAGRDIAFRIRPSLSPRFISWALQFIENCANSRFQANRDALLSLSVRSRAATDAVRARTQDLKFHFSPAGKLFVYDDLGRMQSAAASIPRKNEVGCHQRTVSRDELLAFVPALRTSTRRVVGAIFSPLDQSGDSREFAQGLARIAAREGNLVVHSGTKVDRLVLRGGRVFGVKTNRGILEGDAFVLANGTAAPALLKSLGIRLPIVALKGYSVTLPATHEMPRFSISDMRAKLVFCRMGDRVRIAGFADLVGNDTHIDPVRVNAVIHSAREFMPSAANWLADATPWSGLRPITPDSLPVIGATPIANLFLNCGHGMLGWTLACGSAELITKIMNNEDVMLLHPFGISRFL